MKRFLIPKPFVRTWLYFLRLYTFYFPFRIGKYWLAEKAKLVCPHLPKDLKVKTRDGREMLIDLSDPMTTSVFFFGEYEPFTSEVLSLILEPGTICFDV